MDIGTTGVKAAAVDAAAVRHAGAAREYPTRSPSPGCMVQDPDEVTAAAAAAVRDVMAQVGETDHRVAAVAFSSAMHSLIALGPHGDPLTSSVIWADERADGQARRLRDSAEGLALHQRTGTPVHPMSPLVKLLWFREEQPDIWRSAVHWVGIKEYVLQRLTGALAMDESMASGSGLYGLAARDWDDDALALTGVRRDQLPALHPTTEVVTRLGAGGAASWGLPAGTPVVWGAGDGVLANLGVGAVAPGVTACSIGTSAALRGVVSRPQVDEQGGVFCYVAVPGRWVVGGATSNGGNVLRWLGRVMGADLSAPDTELTELASTVSPGAEGLLMLPYLTGERAPRWTGEPYGALLGLSQRHTRAHIARAALEGVCLQLALVLDAMRSAGLRLTELRATGGFARSPFWRRLLAEALGTPIGFPADEQGSAVGAALLGHVALGHLRSIDEVAHLVRISEVVYPDPGNVCFYRELRAAFAAASEAVPRRPARRPPTTSS